MATKTRSIRAPEALWRLLDSSAKASGETPNALAARLMAEGLGAAAEPEARQAPKPKAAPKSIQHPAPEDKAAAARAALQSAESRTGVVPARLDTSMVPVMARGKRPAYQRGGKR